MPAVWYPGAVQNPGQNAGYKAGRTSMVDCVCHYTVGTDSTGIGLQGYFHWLIARDGTMQQFAEVDATTWHVGEDNAYGPGIEIEYLPGQDAEVFTPQARTACAALIKWLASEWGIPLVYHNGDHDINPGSFAGFVSHKSIIQTEEHQDFWPQTDWDLMVAAPTPPPSTYTTGDDTMLTMLELKDGSIVLASFGNDKNIYAGRFDLAKIPVNQYGKLAAGAFEFPEK